MSDYRRLISYIYEYEGEEKGKNVGFVKLETRNGQCRLSVNVKRIYVGGNAIGVYLLGKSGEKTMLGSMFVRNGSGEFRATVDVENVEGSGNGLDTYYGLTVHDVKHAWRSYTTIWEDAAVPKDRSQMNMQEPKMMQESESVQAQDNVQEPVNAQNQENLQEPANMHNQTNAQESKNTQDQESVQERENLSAQEFSQEQKEENVQSEQPVEDNGNEMREHKQGESDAAFGFTAQDVLPGVNDIRKQEASKESHGRSRSPELEDPDVIRYLQETEELVVDPELLWGELRKNYPKIQPFDDDGGSEVLTIRPQDIGKLPRENWIYGNNSFLLHGYYNFRYLILVRLDQTDGTARYLLGVPGHYYSSEKYMATMFGFPNFVLSKKQPPNDGRFGYWYTDIKMR